MAVSEVRRRYHLITQRQRWDATSFFLQARDSASGRDDQQSADPLRRAERFAEEDERGGDAEDRDERQIEAGDIGGQALQCEQVEPEGERVLDDAGGGGQQQNRQRQTAETERCKPRQQRDGEHAQRPDKADALLQCRQRQGVHRADQAAGRDDIEGGEKGSRQDQHIAAERSFPSHAGCVRRDHKHKAKRRDSGQQQDPSANLFLQDQPRQKENEQRFSRTDQRRIARRGERQSDDAERVGQTRLQ